MTSLWSSDPDKRYWPVSSHQIEFTHPLCTSSECSLDIFCNRDSFPKNKYYSKFTALVLCTSSYYKTIKKSMKKGYFWRKETVQYLLLAALNDDHFGLFMYGDGNKLVQSSLGTCGSPPENIFKEYFSYLFWQH